MHSNFNAERNDYSIRVTILVGIKSKTTTMNKMNKFKVKFSIMILIAIIGIVSIVLKQGYGMLFLTIAVIMYLRDFLPDEDDNNTLT